MGLTQKILLFASALVVALVATTLAYTTFQANRLAHDTIHQALSDTRGVWETFQNDRYEKLTLGVRALANDSGFRALIEIRHPGTVGNTLRERVQDIKADFFIATDPAGLVIARSDRPGLSGEDLSRDPVVMKPLEGEESATIWKQGDKLFHAVSAPMAVGEDLKGVLIAGYGINESLAGDIRKLTHCEIAYLIPSPGRPPQLSVSSLGPKEGALKAVLGSPSFVANGDDTTAPFHVDLQGDTYVGVLVALKNAAGETVGSVLALRSLTTEMASFKQFRNSLILVSVVVMILGLGLAYLTASRITGPLRLLVKVVEKARDGTYTGAVPVETGDEIGVLARTFNSLLTDLREKEQMIGFLREGMTLLKKKGAGATAVPATTQEYGTATTAALSSVTAPTAVRIDAGTLFAGRYEIVDTLGKGGMGVVYRARDQQLDEVVAVKVLRPDVLKDDPTLLDRFKQEIKLARKITHRNVLRTHDFGESNGVPYISMEYLEGVALKDLIRQKGALPLGVGFRIAKQMCQGLEAAHRQGVIHRDIKPQNMLIMPESGELKIMDFGIARVSEVKGKGMTSTGTVMGTPDYMAPEQAQGQPADFRCDIYSLGVVLFEVFAGKLPFGGDTVMAVVLGHIQSPPPRPRTINAAVPEELEAVILRCLEKDPAKRYPRVADLLKDLQAVSARTEAAAGVA